MNALFKFLKAFLYLAFAACLITLCCFLLSGCYTERKAMQQTTRAYSAYPGPFAVQVAGWFPPKVSTSTETIYKPGETKYLPADSVFVDCDSAVKAATAKGAPARVNVPCPPAKYRVDTVYSSEKIERESEVMRAALQSKYDAMQTKFYDADVKLQVAEKAKSSWRNWALAGGIWAVVSLLVIGFLLFRKLKPL